MWPGEREELTAWADALQAEGAALGGLIGLGLRAEQHLREGDDPTATERLAGELRERLADEAEALLGPLARAPGVELEWQLGVVRALTITERAQLSPARLLDALDELLRRPALRFLGHLQLDGRVLAGDGDQLALLELLTRPPRLTRLRRLVLGPMPARFRVIDSVSEAELRRLAGNRLSPRFWSRAGQHLQMLREHGLVSLCRNNQPLGLPWARGPATIRLRRLEGLLAHSPWTAEHVALIGAALWDPSIRVRRRALAAIPELPDAAAPLLPNLIAIGLDGHKLFGDLVARGLTRASSRPLWVRAVAENWRWREPWVASWLAAVPRQAVHEVIAKLPYMRDQAARAHEARDWLTYGRIEQALARLSAR